jgi:hypothetical protein
MTDPTVSPVALRQRRELTISRLCEHFARDDIDADELERLIDGAHQAKSLAELEALTAALPSLERPSPRQREESMELATLSSRPEQQLVLAVMGGAVRKGGWRPGRNVYVTAFMGGACLDFREANLDAGVTEVYVLAIMGGVEIIVPPGLRVESNGIGIMGGFDHGGPGTASSDPRAPVLRVSGLAMMGGVEIRERAPGEDPRTRRAELRDQRRALREEWKERRREVRGELRRIRRGGHRDDLDEDL